MVNTNGKERSEHGPFALLTRHFFGRLFDNEVLSPGGDAAMSISQIMAILPLPGTILSLYYLCMKYTFKIAHVKSWAAVDSWSDRCFFVSFAMIVMGLATLLNWDTLFPDRKDFTNLAVLPIRLRTLFLAKVTSLILFMTLFSVVTNSVSGILFPLAATVSYATAADSFRFLGAHFVSVFAASVFMFLFLVALQGACMALLSRRLFQRISVAVQSSLLVLVLSSLFVMSDLIVAVRGTQVRLYQVLFIPAWFTALYDRLLGIKPLHASSLTWHFSVIALVVALLLATVFYALAYRRHLGFFSQPSEKRDSRAGIAAGLLGAVRRAFTREPESAAAFDFVTATLARSPRHRLVLGSCLGVALAFCLSALFIMITRGGEASLHRLSVTLLGIPAILSLFLLGGVRFAFTLPSELGANWVFRMPALRQDVFWRGTRAAVWTIILGPIFLVTLAFFTYCWGWSTALRFSLLQTLCAVVLAEWLFLRFPKLPFTCSYLPGKADLKCRWSVYVVLFRRVCSHQRKVPAGSFDQTSGVRAHRGAGCLVAGGAVQPPKVIPASEPTDLRRAVRDRVPETRARERRSFDGRQTTSGVGASSRLTR